ncbi:YheC/YheD family protein [Paenibacillus sp. NPDC056579]|uniref:YheC/YheD family protein n=1 Tax=unclassified Paenibacillus TaxID=185978 RepID=UPI001EF88259|nr:YheC/YheD family protein [Paenibacillus sp. H1-7]
MKGNLLKYPGRKWLKHEALWSEPELRTYLPETELFSPQSFKEMVGRHSVLFLKPDLGMQGQGILKVTRGGEDACTIQTASHTYRFTSLHTAATKLEQRFGEKRYIVQQGIDLIRFKGNPVDYRVLLLISANEKWKFYGIMGKVAAKNQFVTNYSSGGKAIGLHQALAHTLRVSKKDAPKWDERIKVMSFKIAEGMKRHFPNITELGLDLAIDTKQHIWLLEANTKPQFQLFRFHSDPQLFGKIASSIRSLRSTDEAKEES